MILTELRHQSEGIYKIDAFFEINAFGFCTHSLKYTVYFTDSLH